MLHTFEQYSLISCPNSFGNKPKRLSFSALQPRFCETDNVSGVQCRYDDQLQIELTDCECPIQWSETISNNCSSHLDGVPCLEREERESLSGKRQNSKH